MYSEWMWFAYKGTHYTSITEHSCSLQQYRAMVDQFRANLGLIMFQDIYNACWTIVLLSKLSVSEGMSDLINEHYAKGKELANQNAYSLMSSAVLMKEKANYGLAQSLALLAYEEAQKAVYCSMAVAGLVSYEDIRFVFEKHQPKIILFDRIFKEHVTITGKDFRFDTTGQNIAEMILASLHKNEVTKEHNDEKNAGLYVNELNGKWSSPADITETDVQPLIKEYKERITILHLLSEVFLREDYDKVQQIKGFSGTTYAKTDGSMGGTIFFASKTKDAEQLK